MQEGVMERYLEQLILFKSTKDLNNEFLDMDQREKLLKDLTVDLGFEEEIWEMRRTQALQSFVSYDSIRDDTKFRDNGSGSWIRLQKEYLEKAIALDPFNEEYLKAHVFSGWGTWKQDKSLCIRYTELFPLASTDSTNLQVEFELSAADLTFDYFRSETIEPYIEQLIFLRDSVSVDKVDMQKVDEMDQLVNEVGYDSKAKSELEGELERMLDMVLKSVDDHWLDWKELHKAFLAAEKLVDLDPYNPLVLHAGIRFYADLFWRSISDAGDLKGDLESKKAFFRSQYGKEQLKYEDKKRIAEDAIRKAKELQRRFDSLPKSVYEKKDDDDFDFDAKIRAIERRMYRYDGEINPQFTAAFIEGQTLSMLAQVEQLRIRKQSIYVGLGIGAVLYALSAIGSIYGFGSIHFLWTFFVVPGLAAGGLTHLWLKRALAKDKGDLFKEQMKNF